MSTSTSRQRPKVANYSERHVVKETHQKKPNLAIPKKAEKPGNVDSKRVRVASSGKPVDSGITKSVSDGGGKMTKFRSLDDIPDIAEDYTPHFKDDDDYDDQYNDEKEDDNEYEDDDQDDQQYYRQQHQQYQQQQQSSYQSPQKPPPLPAEKQRQPMQHVQHQYVQDDDYCDQQDRYGYEQDDDDYDFDDISDDDDEPVSLLPHPVMCVSIHVIDASFCVQIIPPRNAHAAPRGAVPNKSTAVSDQRRQPPQQAAVRRPSPIVYDEDAGRKGRQQGQQKVYTEEEKLYFDRQPREVNYKYVLAARFLLRRFKCQ
jgi:hypothetical protein